VTATGETYRDLERRWKGLRATHDLQVREVACVGAPRTMLCVEFGDSTLPSVAIATGVHGDEPAGPWALLELVETRSLDARFAYRLWPCTNPTGFNARTRESADGCDVNRTFGRGGGSPEAKAMLAANRDRAFLLSLDLHEDRDASGFYCYEYGDGEIGRPVLDALGRAGFPLDPLEDGWIRADAREEARRLGSLSYTLAIARRAARYALTFETPSTAAWDARLAMHSLAVRAALSSAALRIPSAGRVT